MSLSQTIVLACSVVSDSLRPHGLYMAHQATRSLRFSRQEYRSGLPFPIAGDLPNPGIEPASLASPALAGRFLTAGPPGKPVTDYRGLSNPHTTPCSAPKTSCQALPVKTLHLQWWLSLTGRREWVFLSLHPSPKCLLADYLGRITMSFHGQRREPLYPSTSTGSPVSTQPPPS